MSGKDTNLRNPETQKRLALLGLAAQRREAEPACPDDERFALFLEAGPGSAEQQRFFEHLSECDACREKWLVLSSELDDSADSKAKTGILQSRRGLLGIAGSACAVAVGVMLYLSIDYRPVRYEGTAPQAPADQAADQAAEAIRVDGLKKEAEAEKVVETDASHADTEMKRNRRVSQLQQPARVKTSPAPGLARAPLEPRRPPEPLSDPQSFSGAGEAVQPAIRFAELVDTFASWCDDGRQEISRAAVSEDILEQGKGLLDLAGALAPDQRGLLEKIVQLLGGSEPVKDTELDQLCEEAGRIAARMDRPPR